MRAGFGEAWAGSVWKKNLSWTAIAHQTVALYGRLIAERKSGAQ